MSASIHPALLQARQQAASQSKKMSITQTFYLAHKARSKLSSEAARSDHDLRLLVGHANLLDSLMLHLQHAEREQDAWFNAMVRGNSTEEDDTEIMDSIAEEEEEETFGSLAQDYPESDSSSDDDDEDYELDNTSYIASVPRHAAYNYRKTVIDVDEVEDDDEFEEEEDGFYALRRTSSHAPMSPPELIEDDDSDSESNPPSPPQPTLAEPLFYDSKTEKHASKSFYHSNSPADLEESSFYQSSNMIQAF